MTCKMGRIHITNTMLHSLLQLPEGITLERIYEDDPGKIMQDGLGHNLIISGEILPIDDIHEGHPIHDLVATIELRGLHGKIWTFRRA